MATPLPDWMESLTEELGLGDTPAVLAEGVTSLLEVVRKLEFTPQGWRHVKKLIVNDKAVSQTPLFQRITEANDEDLLLFTAMVAIPYGLARAMGYDEKHSEKLINYFTASYVIAMSRGYDLGKEDNQPSK
ncbi:hypothetical protein LCGC14_1329290 [marine sediment metagenome]|uniref:Uncharacterized protein n=1 Tax=marine sediment metagenome TaxID=412755 RepID=A0A0F9KH33_9ZZZZ